MQHTVVRLLTPHDAEAFSRLRLLGLEMHPQAFGTGAAAWRQATPEQVRAYVDPAAAAQDRFVLGAFVSDELVGQVGLRREARAAVHHKGSLWGLIVHPDHRRRGIGSSLLQSALDAARACEGLQYLRVVVTTDCEDAMRLFASHGFVRYGLEAGGLSLADAAYDQAFLRCDVDTSG